MNSHPPTDHRADWAFLLVFALLAAGLITASYFYQRSNEQNYRAEVVLVVLLQRVFLLTS